MSTKKYLFIILIISIATHFAFFGHPDETVFDEVHFGKFVSGYYTHEYYFDIHPPLGKLMVAGFAKLFNFQPEFDFAKIGEKFPDKKYLSLRFLPSLAGTLLPLVVFLLALRLKLTPRTSFFAGLFVTLENGLLVQTRYILMDSFLLLFGFLSLLFYFHRKLFLMAIFGSLAISVKWTGLTFLALPFLIEVFQILRQGDFKKIFKIPVYFLVIPTVIYFSVFAIHFSLLTKPGPGDAFMKPDFRKENILKNFIDLNIEMYNSNQRLTATHPYSSRWYTWPFMSKPIYYWVSNTTTSSGQAAKIYLFGNPVIWWGSTTAVVLLFLEKITSTVRKIFKKKSPVEGGLPVQTDLSSILLAGYFLNLLPFIGINRVMFLYHYLTALVFAILMFAYLLEKLGSNQKIFIILTFGSAVVFLYFAPLTYGLSF